MQWSVATIAEASRILQEAPPDLVATDVTLTDGSSTGLVQQAIALGVSTLMMTGNPDRIVEFDGAGRPYLSKPFTPELCKGSMKYSGRRMTFSVRATVAKRGSSSPPCAPRAARLGRAPFLAENVGAMTQMMVGMQIKPSGHVVDDFVAMMIPHHAPSLTLRVSELTVAIGSLTTNISEHSALSSNAAAVWPKSSCSPARMLTPMTTRSCWPDLI